MLDVLCFDGEPPVSRPPQPLNRRSSGAVALQVIADHGAIALVTYCVTQCVMIRTWRHKGLKELFETGAGAKLKSDQQRRCLRILDALSQGEKPDNMNVPGWHFHGLQGHPKRWAVAVNGPWRSPFEFELGDALNVTLEQYH